MNRSNNSWMTAVGVLLFLLPSLQASTLPAYHCPKMVSHLIHGDLNHYVLSPGASRLYDIVTVESVDGDVVMGVADYLSEHSGIARAIEKYARVPIEGSHLKEFGKIKIYQHGGEAKLTNNLMVPAVGKVAAVNETMGLIAEVLKEQQNGKMLDVQLSVRSSNFMKLTAQFFPDIWMNPSDPKSVDAIAFNPIHSHLDARLNGLRSGTTHELRGIVNIVTLTIQCQRTGFFDSESEQDFRERLKSLRILLAVHRDWVQTDDTLATLDKYIQGLLERKTAPELDKEFAPFDALKVLLQLPTRIRERDHSIVLFYLGNVRTGVGAQPAVLPASSAVAPIVP